MADMAENQPTTGESTTPRVSDGWQVSLAFKTWKMKEKRAFDRLLIRADAEQYVDEGDCYSFMPKLIEKWPYPLDPADPNSYDEITVEQFQECWTQIQLAFQVLQLRAK